MRACTPQAREAAAATRQKQSALVGPGDPVDGQHNRGSNQDRWSIGKVELSSAPSHESLLLFVFVFCWWPDALPIIRFLHSLFIFFSCAPCSASSSACRRACWRGRRPQPCHVLQSQARLPRRPQLPFPVTGRHRSGGKRQSINQRADCSSQPYPIHPTLKTRQAGRQAPTHRATNSISDMSAASPGRYRCSFSTRV